MDTFFLILKFFGCWFALSFVCVAFFCLGAIMCDKAEKEARELRETDGHS